MSKSRRPKQQTNPAPMSTDTPENLDETPVDVVTETVETPAPAVAVTEEPAPTALPSKGAPIQKEVLRAVFNKRMTAAVDDTLWADAVSAVRAGKLVSLQQTAPFVNITQDKFVQKADGAASVSVLNNLIAGML